MCHPDGRHEKSVILNLFLQKYVNHHSFKTMVVPHGAGGIVIHVVLQYMWYCGTCGIVGRYYGVDQVIIASPIYQLSFVQSILSWSFSTNPILLFSQCACVRYRLL